MTTLPAEHRPELENWESFHSDSQALNYLQQTFNELCSRVDAGIKVKALADRQLADHTKAFKERQKKRKADEAELEARIAALRTTQDTHNGTEKGILQDEDEQVAEKRREELNIKLQRWKLKEAELKSAVDLLEAENGESLEVNVFSPTEPLDEIIEEINLINEANENLKNQKENLELKHAEVQYYLDEIQLAKNGIQNEKGDLGKKISQMKVKNKKDEDKLWELLATHEALHEEIQAVDKEMEALRDDNQYLQAETEQLEVLSKGLDEQEQINIMLEEKLRALTAKLNNQPYLQELETTSKSAHQKSATKPAQAKLIAPTSKSSSIIKKNSQLISELEKKAQVTQRQSKEQSPAQPVFSRPQTPADSKSIASRLKSLN